MLRTFISVPKKPPLESNVSRKKLWEKNLSKTFWWRSIKGKDEENHQFVRKSGEGALGNYSITSSKTILKAVSGRKSSKNT